MSRGLVVVAVVALLLVVVAACLAQDAKPWEKPGTKAGDEIIGPDGGKMVWVPAGQFTMGSPEGEGADQEHPAHRVQITKGFWLGKCTVTNAQYRRYCRETGADFPLHSYQGENHPVVGLTWTEAQAYSQHYGLSLPTEAQWEYAARGPAHYVYPWGNAWDEDKCCNAGYHGPENNSFPVGSFPEGASWCGALDMAGNVFQWCQDWYSVKYYANSPDADPSGPAIGDNMPLYNQSRLLRGGSWDGDRASCRSAHRVYSDPSMSSDDLGFRGSRTP